LHLGVYIYGVNPHIKLMHSAMVRWLLTKRG